ncbi:unnamed protein product [Linum tenue]|uniref:CCHC-type domain-containing protein n=1 Tax=Linum tenue TaxID=586396 RepID=A0AAV0Q2B4_9ROSI|nr:unnamed protein product [Linum tenue]
MMDTAGEVPIYVGGDVDRVQLLVDQISYFELVSTLIEDLEYSSVERVWYLTPGQSMEHGLHEIRTDADVINGLLVVAELGEVSLFFEATKFIHEMGDNYGHSEEVEDEDDAQNGVGVVATRHHNIVHCSRCGGEGHNKRSCTNPPAPQPAPPASKRQKRGETKGGDAAPQNAAAAPNNGVSQFVLCSSNFMCCVNRVVRSEFNCLSAES